jgi:hypothetical protein
MTTPPALDVQALNAQTDHLTQSAMAIYVSHLGAIEFFSAIVCILFLVGIIMVIIKTGWWTTKVHNFQHVYLHTNFSKELAKKEWKKIENHFYRGDENDLKMAVIEADKLLEVALRESGVRGVNLGDRLKNIKSDRLPNIDQLWQAHRLRNQIVHEPTFKLKRDLAEKALDIYKTTFTTLRLLD